jgi:hypothetical protein
MAEAIFAGAALAITLRWLSRSVKEPNGFVRHSSRSAFMRDLNRKMEEQTGRNP